MEDQNYTIKDIARMAGVSAGTVDRVLHNRGDVSEKSKEKVRDLEYGYSNEPNPVLRRFANRVEKMAYLRLDREMASWQ